MAAFNLALLLRSKHVSLVCELQVANKAGSKDMHMKAHAFKSFSYYMQLTTTSAMSPSLEVFNCKPTKGRALL